jgi:thiol-disulfide isomerase/thioredoxin
MSAIAPMGAPVSRANGAAPGAVTVIKPAELPAAIAQGKVVVEFFAYGCPYCQRARGPVAEAARRMAADARVVAVPLDHMPGEDVTRDSAGMTLGKKYGLSYFPTFAIFENGKHVGTFARNGNIDVTADYVVGGVKQIYARVPRMNGIG